MITTIRVLRAIKGLTQRELAQRLGLSQSMWNRIETGQRSIEPELLVKLAEALAVTPADLQGYVHCQHAEREARETFGCDPRTGQPLEIADES